MQDIERQKLQPAQVAGVLDDRGRPEVHVHVAATFVWGGDPGAFTKDTRDQKEIEIGQFATMLRHGAVSQADLDRVFSEFQMAVTDRLRQSGALIAGV